MRLPQWTVALMLTVALTAVGLAAPVAADSEEVPGLPMYIALGDSWAFGQGAENPSADGYVAQLRQAIRTEFDCLPAESDEAADGCKHLQLLNLARPATDTLPGVTTPIVASEQLPVALMALESRNRDSNPRNDVELITLQVGGNDAFEPIVTACLQGFSPVCQTVFENVMGTYAVQLNSVVGQLRAAAGPETPIVLGTYDNTVPYCYLGAFQGAKELGDLMLEGSADGQIPGLHDVVRLTAANYGAVVAEVFGQIDPGNFVGGSDCLHITTGGHTQVAQAFRTALGG